MIADRRAAYVLTCLAKLRGTLGPFERPVKAWITAESSDAAIQKERQLQWTAGWECNNWAVVEALPFQWSVIE